MAGRASELPRLTGPLDPRAAWTASECSLARALDVVSTRSAFLLLREAFYGTTRFDDFAERAGISEPVAAARLRELVDGGAHARAVPRTGPAGPAGLPADGQGRGPVPRAGRPDAVG